MSDNGYGPTWEDVYDYVNRLEILWGVVVFLQMRLHHHGKPPRLVGQCSAIARLKERPIDGPEWVGTWGFRGNSGAKTAPQAYWHALSDLEGKITVTGPTTPRQTAF